MARKSNLGGPKLTLILFGILLIALILGAIVWINQAAIDPSSL
ncbi:MAG: hypothetical protein ACR2PW_04575 [Gammaproteobacteria bacterium]